MSAIPDDPLPWHHSAWKRLTACRKQRKVPHALLIAGLAGLGKSALAVRFARRLLCLSPTCSAESCGDCRSCRLVAAGSHPDYYAVHAKGEADGSIKIDQIRELIDFLMRSSQYGGRRLALLDPADAMTLPAANSLLKSLEEPPAEAVIMLITRAPSALAATLRSRCRLMQLHPPPEALAREWLAEHSPDAIDLLPLAAGAPLRAIAYAQGGVAERYAELLADLLAIAQGHRAPVLAAQNWVGTGLGVRGWVELLQLALAELARARFADCDPDRILGQAEMQALREIIESRHLHEYIAEVTAIRRVVDQPLNEPLVIEDLLIGWRNAVHGALPQMTG